MFLGFKMATFAEGDFRRVEKTINGTMSEDFLYYLVNHMGTLKHWEDFLQIMAPHTCVFLMVTIFLVNNFALSKKEKENLSSVKPVFAVTSWIRTLKSLTSAILALTYLLQAFINGECNFDLAYQHGEDFTKVGQAVTFVVVAGLAILENINQKPLSESRSILVFWTFAMVSAFIKICHRLSTSDFDTYYKGVLTALQFCGIFLGLYLSWLIDKSWFDINGNLIEDQLHPKSGNPEESASLWSTLTMGWVYPLVKIGFTRDLEESDVPNLSPQDQCRNVIPVIERAWKLEEYKCFPANALDDETNHANDDKKPLHRLKDSTIDNKDSSSSDKDNLKKSLVKALFRAYGFKFIVFHTCRIVSSMHDFISPLLMAVLISHINNRANESPFNGIFIVVFMFAFYWIAHLFDNFTSFLITRLCTQIRTSLGMFIYKKYLTICNEETKDKTTDEQINLALIDSITMCETFEDVYMIGEAPVKVLLGIYLLYCQLGWATLPAASIIILLIPLNVCIGREMFHIHSRRMRFRTNRIKLTGEIISGIKMLKFYAWENTFIDRICKLRAGDQLSK